ncbi:hypothetical protein [aff. Roholtiella sp. LEGE 12411]|uniref:hypothetical protein n=1 Tax=aff. Roholtiella sp. LEGE 12411 TaxID=1828822 RepID=UPI00187FEEEE|nr:hypothetical protein [aff. Roholtiella sp. LEGE 12411]MBE9039030.1 hypothetical protein [aff. Roholtiella sp. LEGE 12411]
MARIQKQFSMESDEQAKRLEDVVERLASIGNGKEKELMGKPTISRLAQGLADGWIIPSWNEPSDIYKPIIQLINQKQSFRIQYEDVAGKIWGYTVRYAKIVERMYKMGHIRPYLDCWCDEGAGNQEIPELSHNWSLRLNAQKYTSAMITPIAADWRTQGRDSVDIEIELSGGLAWGYEGNPDDIADSGIGKTRQITRHSESTYWLLRELAPHIVCHPGSVKILEPDSLRSRLAQIKL